MSVFSRFDAWAAKRLFHPPIIKACQKFRCTQFSVANHLVLASSMLILRRLMLDDDLILSCFMGVLVVCFIVATAVWPDRTGKGNGFMRAYDWGFLVGASIIADWDGAGIFFLLLVSEYARTLDTIPPEETKERERKLAPARSASQ